MRVKCATMVWHTLRDALHSEPRVHRCLNKRKDYVIEETRHAELNETEMEIIEVLKAIYDPEIPVNIYEMGLVYDVNVSTEEHALIHMTLTSPNCPVAQSLPAEVAQRVIAVNGVETADVDIVWDPPWSPDRMSEAGRLTIGNVLNLKEKESYTCLH